MNFTNCYKGNRPGEKPEEFSWDLNEFYDNQAKYPYLCEFLKCNIWSNKIKPFFDFDMKWKSQDELPTENEAQEIYKYVTKKVSDIFVGEPNIIIAWRDPGVCTKFTKKDGEWIPNTVWEISLRLWVLNCWTTANDLKQQLKNYHPQLTDLDIPQKMRNYDFAEGLFDVSVYNKDKKINFIGKCKDRGDSRVLKYQDEIPIENYLIQLVPDDHNEVNWKRTITCLDSPVSKKLKNAGYISIGGKENLTILPPEKSCIINFVKNKYPVETDDVILKGKSIIVSTRTRYCDFKEAEHRSNHQYIVIDCVGSKRKCHSEKCKGKENNPVVFTNFPEQMREIVVKYTSNGGDEATKRVKETEKECTEYVKKYFDSEIDTMKYIDDTKMFTASASSQSIQGCTCKPAKIEHQVYEGEYCLRCIICKISYPKIPHEICSNFKNLINMKDNRSDEQFSCDVSLHSNCGTGDLTYLYNQILDGHKTAKISELLSKMDSNFVYANAEYFNFNGSIWKLDKESLYLRKSVLELARDFGRIKTYYESLAVTETNAAVIKNLKSLITKLNKPSLKNDIISEAKMYFYDEEFYGLLNSKKHLIPFKNGVFDLVRKEFRKTERDDYINLTVKYDYDPDAKNPEVIEFIENILPQEDVRHYVLKRLADCLDGDIPNTYFVMFTGDGANGKSQLINLMKHVMGEFGEKIEVTLLTRKRNNANEANPEKIKLVNKRFGFLSEPEHGEKLNVGLLKELTGSEEIVSRGLYKGSFTFVMETKLFLACNALPDVHGEDTAIWRRVRVVNFTSRFVDEPHGENDFLIDRSLPSRLREDVTWRQTLMNILIEYHYMYVPEPDAVKITTNSYKEESNDLKQWLEENVIASKDSILQLKEIATSYTGKLKVHSSEASKIKTAVETFIKDKHANLEAKYKSSIHMNTRYSGWLHLKLLS